MKLFLMRHGQAADIEVDPEQGLSAEGKAAIEQLAHRLAEQNITFKQVFYSEKARARQTAEIMAG
ncbi:MAG: histidine phosphatase family protein, partial [Gammaproteobacteria bacterium]|nr:histidine phosphatase family protein [Gammaproteobacteria bacterium]